MECIMDHVYNTAKGGFTLKVRSPFASSAAALKNPDGERFGGSEQRTVDGGRSFLCETTHPSRKTKLNYFRR